MLTALLEYCLATLFNGIRQTIASVLGRRRTSALVTGKDDRRCLLGHSLETTLNPHGRPAPPTEIWLPDTSRRKHVFVTGSTGCGKTTLMLRLIEHDIQCKRSLVAFDLRGDTNEKILRLLARTETPETLRERLVLIDLRDKEYVVAFNPLGAGENEDSVHNRAFGLLGVLRKQSESWGVQLEETLRNTLLALAEGGWSLLEIEPFLLRATFRAEVLRKSTDRAVLAFFARYDQLSVEKQLSLVQPVTNKITPLTSLPAVRRFLSARRPSFSFRHLLDHTPGTVILITLGVDQLYDAAYLVGGLLLASLQMSLMARIDIPEAERVPVHMYLDEFQTIATERFEVLLTEGRRYGVGLYTANQHLAQLSPSLRHTLRNNAHTQLYFQTGALDAAELAHEINAPLPRESLRERLTNQEVGQAYLIRRGQPSVPIQTLPYQDPPSDQEAVEALRQAARHRYGRSYGEVERDQAERERFMEALSLPTAQRASRSHATFQPGASLPFEEESSHASKSPGMFQPKTRPEEPPSQ